VANLVGVASDTNGGLSPAMRPRDGKADSGCDGDRKNPPPKFRISVEHIDVFSD
jgi:hypothetical protein